MTTDESPGLSVDSISAGELCSEGFQPVTVHTSRGALNLRHYLAPGARAGVIWMGGVGGGWDTPAQGLYPRLASELVDCRLSSCRVRFRQPTKLGECVLDALVAVHFLVESGCRMVGVVGHSLGGAVALQTALHATEVRTVVTLATQTTGAMAASALPRTTSVLLVHGRHDERLPATCSVQVHEVIGGPKRLVLIDNARHRLDEAASEVDTLVRAWLLDQLRPAPS